MSCPRLVWLAGCLPWMVAAAEGGVAVNIDSVIHPITVEIVRHGLEQARREGSNVLLVRLNTPGGFLQATRETVQVMRSSPIPVVTLVRPNGARAASAGFFLLLAGDVAAMTNGTNTGAATPVALGQAMDPVMRKKVESDAAAWMRGLAQERGRNAELAEKAVFDAASFTSEEALEKKLIDLTVRDEAELWMRLHGRTVTLSNGRRVVLQTANLQTADYRSSLRERVVSAVADPNLAFLLLMLGALLVYVEFSAPGMIAPGVAGAILVLVALMSLAVVPVSWAGVALLILALVLFGLEIKITSHGVLGAGGAVAMVLGAVLLVEGPPEMRIRWTTALGTAGGFACIVALLVALAMRAYGQPVATGVGALLREEGVAWTDLEPAGTVRIHGEFWKARSVGNAGRGTKVKVKAVEGLLLVVEPLQEKAGKEE